MFDPLQLFVIFAGMIAAAASAYLIGHANGYRDGFRAARTLPIGHMRRLSVGADGLSGFIELDPDIIVTPEENHGD